MQETAELNADNEWSKAWTKLPRKSNGNNIEYTIEELVVPEGYQKPVVEKVDNTTKTPDETIYVNDEKITVTNNHIPETVDVNGIKVIPSSFVLQLPNMINALIKNGAIIPNTLEDINKVEEWYKYFETD